MAFWNKKKKRVSTPKTPVVSKGLDSYFTRDTGSARREVQDFMSGQYGQILEQSFQRFYQNVAKLEAAVNAPRQGVAMDSSAKAAFDNSIQQVKAFAGYNGSGFIPLPTLEWYANQGFVGWQVCAILGQNWLVNKALKMPYLDATRHGFDRVTTDDIEVDPKIFTKMKKLDKKFKLRKNMVEHGKFARMFGIRHTLFLVEGIDYEAPFNIDGVKPGSYKGMTQIDPYWIAPYMSMNDASQPANPHFYDPTFWIMPNGQKIHRSHFVISRNGNELADLLKPSYFYGGIPTTQLIYERIYAAERTANEAPNLAMSKRLYTLKTDTAAAMADIPAFIAKMQEWMGLQTNFSAKIINTEEEIQQFDTSLASFDETIMTQYQLVAAIAEVPETKLLGTAPKGFNATGEYETDSYHEFLESLQEDELTPLVERHTILCQRAYNLAPEIEFDIEWKPTDTPSAKELAEIRKAESDTASNYVTMGALDGTDVRQKISKDPKSGYNGIPEVVPEGPGDRDHEHELAEEARNNEAEGGDEEK